MTNQTEPSEMIRMACMELRGGNRSAVYSAELPGLRAWVSCRPLHPATRGGDLHYLTVCSGGAVSRVVLADVAGHGEVVSDAAERLRQALRQHADSWDQSVLIRDLNNTFLRGADSSNIEYATAFVLSYLENSSEILFTNAGHLPPLWFHAREQRWSLLEDTLPESAEIADLPLGLILGTSYTMTAARMAPGDLLVLYTDGLIESQNEAGEQFGLQRLLASADTLPTGSTGDTGQSLLNAVAAFRGEVPLADDETVVVLQCSPTGAS